MTCQETDVPKPENLDIAAIAAKYRAERERRLVREAANQYERAAGEFADMYSSDPHTPRIERDAIDRDIDVAILGAGWTGILAGYHLKQAGISNFCNIDHAGSWGGVWYWNRYPGLQCDNDAYCYLPLLEETGFMPSKKFADGWEIREYAQSIPKRFGFDGSGLFHTLVKSLRWDEAIKRWRIETDRRDDIRARFVIMASGLLNIPKLPGIPGIHEFRGKLFHAARWDYDYTGGEQTKPVLSKLADKRVAIVGTGATAVQAIPFLAQYAKHLYVLQRTPSTVDERMNPPTDPEWVKTLQPGWQMERKRNFHRAVYEMFLPGEADLVCDIWTEVNRNLSLEFGRKEWLDLGSPEFAARRELMDYQTMERLRRRVDASVHDPVTAEKLKPYYNHMCKRPASNNEYYPTFNRPNMTLFDVSQTRGVERLTPGGFVVDGVEHEIDCLIFASGFEVTSDLERRWGIEPIRGRDGVSIYDCWRDGFKTFHGIAAHGFPNMFFTGFMQSALNASLTEQISGHCAQIAYILDNALSARAEVVEPTPEAQDWWVSHVRETAVDQSEFLSRCTPGFFNGDGSFDSRTTEKPTFYAGDPYGPGWDAYMKVLADWRSSGRMEGLRVERTEGAS